MDLHLVHHGQAVAKERDSERSLASSASEAARRAMGELRALLWPDYRGLGAGFREDLRARALLGLRIVSTIAIVVPVLVVLVSLPFRLHAGLVELFAVAIGVAGLLAARTDWGVRYARGLTLSAGAAMGLLVVLDMLAAGGYTTTVFTGLVIIILLMAIALPLKPLAMLGFGSALVGMFVASAFFDPTFEWPPRLAWVERVVMLIVVTLMGGGLSGLIARLRVQAYESRRALEGSVEALRRTQAGLISSKRAASQGRLAAAFSHEVNTPLSVLRSNQQLLERQLELMAEARCGGDDDAVARSLAAAREAAETSRQAVTRIGRLVVRLQRFTNLDTAERRPVDVNVLLDDAVEVMAAGWGARLRVVKDYAELPRILVYPAALGEVFENVLSNAARAIEEDGEIKVSTRYSRNYAWIQIADSGRGISKEQLNRIFDPGFRIENGRVTTGWGLFIARQIIHDHHGEFLIKSEPARGTEVEICLPNVAAEAAEA